MGNISKVSVLHICTTLHLSYGTGYLFCIRLRPFSLLLAVPGILGCGWTCTLGRTITNRPDDILLTWLVLRFSSFIIFGLFVWFLDEVGAHFLVVEKLTFGYTVNIGGKKLKNSGVFNYWKDNLFNTNEAQLVNTNKTFSR